MIKRLIRVNSQDIRDFLIKEIRFKYKRDWDRPIISKNKSNLKYLWAIFSSQILVAIYENCFIINISESCYNKSVKSSYSWLRICDSNPILNANYTGRTTIIFGLFSKGYWLCMSVNGIPKLKIFAFSCNCFISLSIVDWVSKQVI